MACVQGRFSRLKMSTDKGATFGVLGSTTDIGMSASISSNECTTKDNNGQSSFQAGNISWTMSVDSRWDEDTPMQVALLDALFPNVQAFPIKFMVEDKKGRRMFTAMAFPTSWDVQTPLDDISSLSASLQLSNVKLDVVP